MALVKNMIPLCVIPYIATEGNKGLTFSHLKLLLLPINQMVESFHTPTTEEERISKTTTTTTTIMEENIMDEEEDETKTENSYVKCVEVLDTLWFNVIFDSTKTISLHTNN